MVYKRNRSPGQFVGKRRYKRRRVVSKRTAAPMRRRVVRAVRSLAETKFYDAGAENVQLYHNLGTAVAPLTDVFPTAFYLNPLGVGQNVTTGGRTGDKINSIGLNVRLWLSQKASRQNVMFRILVLRYPDAAYGATYTGINQRIFYPLDTGNAMIERVDTATYSVAYDKIIRPNSSRVGTSAADQEHSVRHEFYLKTAGSIHFRESTSGSATVVPKAQKYRLAMYVIPYDAYGTLTTDNIASFAWTYRHYYKDF